VKKRAAIAATVLTVSCGLQLAGVGERWLTDGVARPIEFRTRHALGHDPKLDPRLKLYFLGDTSVNALGTAELSAGLLAEIVSGLAKQPIRALIVSKTFALPGTDADRRRLAQAIEHVPFPVLGGAFVSPHPIANRPVLDLSDDDFSLTEWMGT